MAHQYLGQLPDHLRESVFGNVGSTIAFRLGGDDRMQLTQQLDLRQPRALRELSNYEAWASTLKDGMPSDPYRFDTYPPPAIGNKQSQKIVQNSRVHFGKDRSKIEGWVDKFYKSGI